MNLLDIQSTDKVLCGSHLKQSSFWLSADVKPKTNVLEHAMLWQCVFGLSLSLDMCVYTIISMAWSNNTKLPEMTNCKHKIPNLV